MCDGVFTGPYASIHLGAFEHCLRVSKNGLQLDPLVQDGGVDVLGMVGFCIDRELEVNIRLTRLHLDSLRIRAEQCYHRLPSIPDISGSEERDVIIVDSDTIRSRKILRSEWKETLIRLCLGYTENRPRIY